MGIKKAPMTEPPPVVNYNPTGFIPSAFPNPPPPIPPGPHHGHFVRQPPTVLQVKFLLVIFMCVSADY